MAAPMIAVDTSALMAIILGEPEAAACSAALEGADQVLISAGTVAEALIVAGRRGFGPAMLRLIEGFDFVVQPVTAATSRRMAEAYGRWGKGVHPARLNLGDCFAYEAAREAGCPLLSIGGDFARTDLQGVL